MRQVPQTQRYLIIGNGRLATHLSHYFHLLNLSYSQWCRKENSQAELISQLPWCTAVLLCIKDDALESFYDNYSEFSPAFVHFSGRFQHHKIHGFHPLMSFDQSLYDLNIYQKISFIGTESQETFSRFFPELKNDYIAIRPEDKNLYHSLCVLGGNGATLLWDLASKELAKIGVPKQALAPYIQQVFLNTMTESPGRFTGPWYRNDKVTILNNQQALKNHNLEHLYDELAQLAQNSEAAK